MKTIYDLKKRAKELSEKNEVNSVSPVEVGSLIDDTLNIIDEYNKNVVGLGIRKTYPNIASMQADGTDPVGNDGKHIRFGQLVSVYDENNPDSEENGGVYAFQNPGWKLATTTAINVVSEYGDSEIEAISQKFFKEQVQGHVIGKVDIKDLDTLNTLSSLGLYHVFDGKRPIGEMTVTGDNMQHTIIQVIFGNYTVKDGTLNAHVDNITTIVYRIYNLYAPNLPGIVRGTWGKWKNFQESFLKSEFGASVTDAVTQKFFTDAVQNVVSGRIDIGNGMSVLDEYNSPEKCGWYVLMRMDKPAYHLLVTSDDMSHVITQFLYGNSVINEDGEIKAHQDYSTTILTRTYNIYAPMLPDIPARTWGKWRYEYESYMVDLPESEYVKLRDAGKVDKNIYYFTYEDGV